jgi:hypothetical protein
LQGIEVENIQGTQTGTSHMDRNVDAIAAAYIHSAQGDCLKALQLAIADALADLLEAERRTLHADRLISHGYARGEFGLGRSEEQRQRLASWRDVAHVSPDQAG